MIKTVKRETGDRGEDLAVEFLMQHRFEIIERNYWRRWGEIDIVARKDEIFHFVEVKTAIKDIKRTLKTVDGTLDCEYSPADNITREKKRRFSRIIQTYLYENKIEGCDWQADVALVYLDTTGDDFKVELIEDIELLL